MAETHHEVGNPRDDGAIFSISKNPTRSTEKTKHPGTRRNSSITTPMQRNVRHTIGDSQKSQLTNKINCSQGCNQVTQKENKHRAQRERRNVTQQTKHQPKHLVNLQREARGDTIEIDKVKTEKAQKSTRFKNTDRGAQTNKSGTEKKDQSPNRYSAREDLTTH